MSSRTALRRERIAQAVLDGAVNNLSLIAETLDERLAADGVVQALETGPEPVVPVEALSEEAAQAVTALQRLQEQMKPDQLPDWRAVQQTLGLVLAFYTSHYMTVDDVYQQESSENWVPRDRRDEALQAAYRDMLAVRRYVSGVLDERAADSLLGLQGATATQPVELRRQMQSAIRRLRDPGSHVPEPRIEGLEPDWEPAIRQLERGLHSLDEALQGLAAESTAALHARARRDAALATHQDMVTGCRNILRGMYILAGRRELLESLRSPFSRRSAGVDPDEEDGELPFDPEAEAEEGNEENERDEETAAEAREAETEPAEEELP